MVGGTCGLDKAGYSTQAKQEYVSFMVLLFFAMSILSPWFNISIFGSFLDTMWSLRLCLRVCFYIFSGNFSHFLM